MRTPLFLILALLGLCLPSFATTDIPATILDGDTQLQRAQLEAGVLVQSSTPYCMVPWEADIFGATARFDNEVINQLPMIPYCPEENRVADYHDKLSECQAIRDQAVNKAIDTWRDAVLLDVFGESDQLNFAVGDWYHECPNEPDPAQCRLDLCAMANMRQAAFNEAVQTSIDAANASIAAADAAYEACAAALCN